MLLVEIELTYLPKSGGAKPPPGTTMRVLIINCQFTVPLHRSSLIWKAGREDLEQTFQQVYSKVV